MDYLRLRPLENVPAKKVSREKFIVCQSHYEEDTRETNSVFPIGSFRQMIFSCVPETENLRRHHIYDDYNKSEKCKGPSHWEVCSP